MIPSIMRTVLSVFIPPFHHSILLLLKGIKCSTSHYEVKPVDFYDILPTLAYQISSRADTVSIFRRVDFQGDHNLALKITLCLQQHILVISNFLAYPWYSSPSHSSSTFPYFVSIPIPLENCRGTFIYND